jgi:hypothetical protein
MRPVTDLIRSSDMFVHSYKTKNVVTPNEKS